MFSAALLALVLALGVFLIVRHILKRSFYRGDDESARQLRKMIVESNNPEFLAEVGIDSQGRRKKKTIKESSPILDRASGRLERSHLLHEKEGKNLLDWIEKQLLFAGLQKKYTPYEALATLLAFWSVGVILPTIAAVAGLLPKLFYVAAVVGFVVWPFAYVTRLKHEREDSLKAELPWFIHELSMALATGAMTLRQAVGYVSRANEENAKRSSLQAEFAQAHLEVQLGGIDWDKAIEDVSGRCQVAAVQNFVSSLINANQTGADIVATLDEYAESATEVGKQETLEFINKKEPQFMIGLVLIVFGLVLIFATPLVINALNTIGGSS